MKGLASRDIQALEGLIEDRWHVVSKEKISKEGGGTELPVRPRPTGPSAITECTDAGDPRQFAPCLGSYSTRIGLFIEGRFQRFTGNIKGSIGSPCASFVKLNRLRTLHHQGGVWIPGRSLESCIVRTIEVSGFRASRAHRPPCIPKRVAGETSLILVA